MEKLSSDLKSKVLKNLTIGIPGFLGREGFETLTTDPEKAIFGYEDAILAEQAVVLNEDNKKKLDETFDSTSLKDLFPNARLSAELDIIKETARNKYDEFKDKIFELDGLCKEIDKLAGPSLDFLLDEVKQIANPEAVDAVKNLGVSLINIEDVKIAKK